MTTSFIRRQQQTPAHAFKLGRCICERSSRRESPRTLGTLGDRVPQAADFVPCVRLFPYEAFIAPEHVRREAGPGVNEWSFSGSHDDWGSKEQQASERALSCRHLGRPEFPTQQPGLDL